MVCIENIENIQKAINVKIMLKMTDNLYDGGYISKRTHDKMRQLQSLKLTSVNKADIISSNEMKNLNWGTCDAYNGNQAACQ